MSDAIPYETIVERVKDDIDYIAGSAYAKGYNTAKTEIALSGEYERAYMQGKKDALHWIPCSERLPENNVPVNITWVNRNPESYYADIKDQPFTATGVHYNNKWYWYSDTIEDILAEYGRAEWYEIEESIEVTAWMPLPEPYGGDKE